MTSSKFGRSAMLIVTLALTGGLMLAGCEKKPTDPKKAAGDAPKDAGKAATDLAGKAKETVKDGADKAKEAVKEGTDAVKASADEAAKAAQARFVEESQKGMDAAKTQFDALKAKVKDLTDPVKKTSLDGLVKGLEGEFGNLTSKFTALKDAKPADAAGLSSDFSALLKKVTDGIAAAMSQIGK